MEKKVSFLQKQCLVPPSRARKYWKWKMEMELVLPPFQHHKLPALTQPRNSSSSVEILLGLLGGTIQKDTEQNSRTNDYIWLIISLPSLTLQGIMAPCQHQLFIIPSSTSGTALESIFKCQKLLTLHPTPTSYLLSRPWIRLSLLWVKDDASLSTFNYTGKYIANFNSHSHAHLSVLDIKWYFMFALDLCPHNYSQGS